jgi:hypothetical protein
MAGPAAAGASTKENPRLLYATGSAGLATLEHFRKINIEVAQAFDWT